MNGEWVALSRNHFLACPRFQEPLLSRGVGVLILWSDCPSVKECVPTARSSLPGFPCQLDPHRPERRLEAGAKQLWRTQPAHVAREPLLGLEQ